jgi:hypothetical protein
MKIMQEPKTQHEEKNPNEENVKKQAIEQHHACSTPNKAPNKYCVCA